MTRTHVTPVAVTVLITAFAATASADPPKKKKKDTKEGDSVSVTATAPAPKAEVTVAAPTVKTEVGVAAPSGSVGVVEPAHEGTGAVVVVNEEGLANRAGFSVAAQVGFLAGSSGYSSFATGVRGGYTFPFHLYLGADATFYFAGLTVISLAPEVGYDIGVGRSMVVRPYVGIGFVDVTTALVGGSAFEIYPGGEFLYHITPGFFVGGDARVPLFFVSGATGVGFNLMGTVGYKF
jgi:hypothetical protein